MLEYDKKKIYGMSKAIESSNDFKSVKGGDWKQLQSQCEELLLYYPDIKLIRVPDMVYNIIFGTYSNTPQLAKAVISKWLKGLPDHILLKEDKNGYCKAICIELKAGKAKMRQGQKKFASKLPVHIIRSTEEYKEKIEIFIGRK